MILSSATKKPKIHSSAYVAPSATIAGDVTIGAGCAVLHGAVISAEGAPIVIGSDSVIMENAVIKASGGSALQFPVSIGDRCIIGPQVLIVGAEIGDGCYVSAGARVYNGLTLKAGEHVAANDVRAPKSNFFEAVWNIEGPTPHAQAAETYARFLRKTHAQDTVLDAHVTTAQRARRSGEEPPPQQMTEVDGVVDAMMLELQEMELRRQEALKKKPKR